MTASELVAALDLPPGAAVDVRVPKKLLAEQLPTASARRQADRELEALRWVAVLKPAGTGVPAYVDPVREYLEVAVLVAAVRAEARASRLAMLLHRAVPYPVVLAVEAADSGAPLHVSLAHKRWVHGSERTTVVDGELEQVEIGGDSSPAIDAAFRDALALRRQPREDLYQLYQGWLDCLTTLRVAQRTGRWSPAPSRAASTDQRLALTSCARLDLAIRRLRASARRERQMARQVEKNLELRRLQAELADAEAVLARGAVS